MKRETTNNPQRNATSEEGAIPPQDSDQLQLPPSTPANREALKLLFDKAYDAYQADNERFWRMVNFISVVNGGLLGFLAYAKDNLTLWVAASIVGVVLCIAWRGMQMRYAWWCAWWDRRLAEVETAYLATFHPCGAHVVEGPFLRHASPRQRIEGWSTRKSAKLIPLSFGAAWLFILVFGILVTVPIPLIKH